MAPMGMIATTGPDLTVVVGILTTCTTLILVITCACCKSKDNYKKKEKKAALEKLAEEADRAEVVREFKLQRRKSPIANRSAGEKSGKKSPEEIGKQASTKEIFKPADVSSRGAETRGGKTSPLTKSEKLIAELLKGILEAKDKKSPPSSTSSQAKQIPTPTVPSPSTPKTPTSAPVLSLKSGESGQASKVAPITQSAIPIIKTAGDLPAKMPEKLEKSSGANPSTIETPRNAGKSSTQSGSRTIPKPEVAHVAADDPAYRSLAGVDDDLFAETQPGSDEKGKVTSGRMGGRRSRRKSKPKEESKASSSSGTKTGQSKESSGKKSPKKKPSKKRKMKE